MNQERSHEVQHSTAIMLRTDVNIGEKVGVMTVDTIEFDIIRFNGKEWEGWTNVQINKRWDWVVPAD